MSQVRCAIQQPLVVAPQELEEISKMAAEEVEGRVSREVFTSYTAKHSVFSSAKPHPADIVEAASLAVSTHCPCFVHVPTKRGVTVALTSYTHATGSIYIGLLVCYSF